MSAERLAEALRWAMTDKNTPTRHSREVCPEYATRWDEAHAALREHDEALAAHAAEQVAQEPSAECWRKAMWDTNLKTFDDDDWQSIEQRARELQEAK